MFMQKIVDNPEISIDETFCCYLFNIYGHFVCIGSFRKSSNSPEIHIEINFSDLVRRAARAFSAITNYIKNRKPKFVESAFVVAKSFQRLTEVLTQLQIQAQNTTTLQKPAVSNNDTDPQNTNAPPQGQNLSISNSDEKNQPFIQLHTNKFENNELYSTTRVIETFQLHYVIHFLPYHLKY